MAMSNGRSKAGAVVISLFISTGNATWRDAMDLCITWHQLLGVIHEYH